MNDLNALSESSDYINFFLHIHEAPEYSYNLYNNLACLDEYYSAQALFGQFNTVQGLISNANALNPQQLETLQQNQDTLFLAYDTGLNGFSQNSITAHFGVGFDPKVVQELRMMVHSGFETPFIFNTQFNADAVRKIHGHKLLLLDSHDVILRWFIHELNIQSQPIKLREGPNFCLEVAKGFGCHPIINLAEESNNLITSAPPGVEQPTDLPRRPCDLLNWVQAEIQQCPVHIVSKEQVYKVLDKWSKSLESGLHIIYNILDYLKPIRDKLLIHKEAIPEDLPSKLIHYSQNLEGEPIYIPLLKNCTQVFDNMHNRELEKQKINIDALDDEKQRILYLQHQISLYDFLKHQSGIHFQTVQKVLQELSLTLDSEKNISQPSKALQQPHPSNAYEFSALRYCLKDPALNIHFEENFDQNQHPFPHCRQEFHANGALKSEIYHRNGLKHGPSSFYNSEGHLLAKGWFVDNERTGVNLQYYPKGQIYSVQRFKKDLADGVQEFFYPNGTLKTVYKCHEGKKEGEALLFYPSGNLKRRIYFKAGKRHGLEEMWYPSEIKEVEGEYENGRPKGTIKTWHPNGILAKQMTFHKFPNDFDMTLWNDEGQVIKSSTKSTDAITTLMQRTQELKKLLDETTFNFIELLEKKKNDL